MKKTSHEQTTLISQLEQIAEGLSKTFSPFCEVVLHDLRDPQHAILAIHNNLSGRQPGDPATELGLARIADPDYPQVLANYQNQFADGRQVKSTSIGIKDTSGKYVAALCMNVDLSLFRGLQSMLEQFGSVSGDQPNESLDPSGADVIRARIDQFAARLATTPRALKAADRRLLLQELKDSGCMDVRRAMETVASHLGVSRAAVYTYAK
ncbi:helix-turn-helix transcriptional regulator [Pseudomonas sp. TWRC1-2]|uniref:helix-turn-helix transcriptional regulator n=1 Tax=Pseudomonas sp. TWRC1-2 TaxID=2804628 RepID=UPI003CF5AF1E